MLFLMKIISYKLHQRLFTQRFLLGQSDALLQSLSNVITANPLRHMATPNGYQMSAAMTNCGDWGWVTDKKGYRYSQRDPVTNQPWQPMPISFVQLATSAASTAGFEHFIPDACLINRYAVGAAMSLHQDKDEADFTHPIVSFSLGYPQYLILVGQPVMRLKSLFI